MGAERQQRGSHPPSMTDRNRSEPIKRSESNVIIFSKRQRTIASTPTSRLCLYGARFARRVMRSSAHRANQICKIGAAAEIPRALLSGTGAVPRNAPYVREQISPCGTVDWRKRSTCKVAHFFWLFSFVQRKEHRSPLAKGIDLLRRRKNVPSFQRVFEPFCRKAK